MVELCQQLEWLEHSFILFESCAPRNTASHWMIVAIPPSSKFNHLLGFSCDQQTQTQFLLVEWPAIDQLGWGWHFQTFLQFAEKGGNCLAKDLGTCSSQVQAHVACCREEMFLLLSLLKPDGSINEEEGFKIHHAPQMHYALTILTAFVIKQGSWNNIPCVAVHFDCFPRFIKVASMDTWALIFGNTSSTAIQYKPIRTHAARNTFCDILHV